MAVHRKCPDEPDEFSPDEMLVGTSLIANRCKLIEEDRCKGTGETMGSLEIICKGCSDHYGLCQTCGGLFTRENPKLVE